ncbi:MAG TPA: hypothetical protein VMW15_01580 [Terracidiphilus sp.]|nr:hypothetical protein [Terracidiphilus sp.]
MKKRNITVSVDEETYRAARIWAACNNTSVSAVVRDLLKRLRGARRTPPAKSAPPLPVNCTDYGAVEK